ncbi:MAG: L-histidine N(alpha)-methyltransferase [Pseudomonadota bacterium]
MSSNAAARNIIDSTPEHDESQADDSFASALFVGLTQSEKSIPCRFLYDARGSELFEEITKLDEYYPTRTEAGILRTCAPIIAESVEAGSVLIEFGSGSSLKTELLLSEVQDKLAAYVPLDISEAALVEAEARLKTRFPNLTIASVVADFSAPIALPPELNDRPLLGFFPGSTIGNLEPSEAIALLTSMRGTLGNEGRLIIGTDLIKDLDVLLPAYDDKAGVTAAFNLNILDHANAVVGTNFKADNFVHRAIWNANKSRIEMHLVSTCDQTITGLEQPVKIAQGEHLHTENSHKYTVPSFHALAAKAGWHANRVWSDDNRYFAVHELQVRS